MFCCYALTSKYMPKTQVPFDIKALFRMKRKVVVFRILILLFQISKEILQT